MTDIKQTLAAAFDDEPPLALDKSAIRRAGRHRVAARRGAGVVALSVVAGVGAAALAVGPGGAGGAGGVGTDQAAWQAAAPSVSAPAGDLGTAGRPAGTGDSADPTGGGADPAGESADPTGGGADPTGGSVARTGGNVTGTGGVEGQVVERLTTLLASYGVLEEGSSGQGVGTPRVVRIAGSAFDPAAAVPSAADEVQLTVFLGAGDPLDCAKVPTGDGATCEQRDFKGTGVMVVAKDSDLSVVHRRADGKVVRAAGGGLGYERLAEIVAAAAAAF